MRNRDKERKLFVELIDYQLEEFWPKISNLVSKLNE